MKYTDNAINIITAKAFKGVGRGWIFNNLKGNESINNIVSKLNNNLKNKEIITEELFEYRKNEIVQKLENLNEYCDGIIAIGDENFPKIRGNVKASEQPIFLFYKGDLSLLKIENKNITVIGLLNPSENIAIRERKLVSEIVKRNITIVSGLAFGCDTIAHQEAIVEGTTIAVLPSPLNKIMPTKNMDLALNIVKNGGLLITEYYDNYKSAMELNSRYKDRDRLQALFCNAIILAASYAQDSADRWRIIGEKLDSGARLAMGFAKDYGIIRAVMYDPNIDNENPMFDLNRQLISEKDNIIILTPKSLNQLINDITSNKKINDLREDLFN